MIRKSLSVLALTLLVVSAVSFAADEKPVIEGDKEVLYLNDLLDDSGWTTKDGAEVVVSDVKCPISEKATAPAIAMHIDFKTAPKGGTPRMFSEASFPDFSEWETIEFQMYAKTNHGTTIPAYVGFGPQGNAAEKKITLKKDAWTKFSVPVSFLEDRAKNIERWWFSIDYDKFKKGDVVDFVFGGFKLVRPAKKANP